MRTVTNDEQIRRLESQKALVGTYVDRNYLPEKLNWLFEAKGAFNSHAKDSWHLLIPVKEHGFGVDTFVGDEKYDTDRAAHLIDQLEISVIDLPCIIFRGPNEITFYLKLGQKTRESFCNEIELIAELAIKCQKNGPEEVEAFRAYVYAHTAAHLKQRRILSAAQGALPAISGLISATAGLAGIL